MNHMRKTSSPLGVFKSGTSLGGKVTQYRDNQKIYSQGEPAFTLFYIQHGGVRLTTRSKGQPSAVTAILGAHDFFGEVCLAGYPLRMSTAVTMTASSIRTINKNRMLQLLRKKSKASNAMVGFLLTSLKKYRDHVADLLTSNAEQRLARILLRLAHLEKDGLGPVEIPVVNHQILAEMVGTTRPRVNLFMNRFRKRGYIHYDGTLVVSKTLRKALQGS
jgi:CRP/FNR family transcriptional regulator, cyclic AMP receptor protein